MMTVIASGPDDGIVSNFSPLYTQQSQMINLTVQTQSSIIENRRNEMGAKQSDELRLGHNLIFSV